MKSISAPRNPYTCRLFIRIDRWIYLLKGQNVAWLRGRLCEIYSDDCGDWHGVSVRSHFPDWAFVAAARLQNRFLWTRKVLSA